MNPPPAFSEQQAREQIVAVCQRLDGLDLNSGRAGNMSLAWSRGARDGMLITPSAMSYEHMSADDVVWMPLAPLPGEADAADDATHPVEQFGEHPASSEWRMHRALLSHARAPDGACVLHLHSPYASTLACLPRVQHEGIPAFHYMVAAAGGDDIRCAPYETFGTQALSDALLPAIQDRHACLLAHHGMIVRGASPAHALERARELEWLARVYWQALQVGEPAVLDTARMRAVHARFAASAYRAPEG
ncbi:MAG: class II aldolase/adducin family protein [Burkholderiaceae bacterium]